jgi:putative selenate reductase
MSDIMRPVPFEGLLARIFGEYKACRSIFEIAQGQFYRKADDRLIPVFGETCETPVGPAAGPHTQLAQNIVVSWLTGGRFIELKTVQIMDHLEIAKPCIDAEDECYNTEWSTEYTLPKAFDEYLKAWFALHLLEEVFDPRQDGEAKSFSFNMSVGYNLDGIKQPPMQTFIDSMVDAAGHPKFAEYLGVLQRWVNDEAFIADLGLESRRAQLQSLPARISSKIARGVTLSTMHGCPPHEIEAICRYMLEVKSLNTFVKLNPTLLGFDRVREILDTCGFDYLTVKPESFAHDLKLDQAKAMLHRLLKLSQDKRLSFGVKLTNTLGAVNAKGVLPGDEFYMSGRALFPLSINVAAILSREFKGELPVSYSGGASLFNIRDIFETGIRPITMATDLLKPGGYLRLLECVKALEGSDTWGMTRIDVAKLEALAAKALTADYTQKAWRAKDSIDAGGPLAADRLLRGALCVGLRHPPGHPGVHPPARRRALCRCAGRDLPAQRAAGHHRPHLRPPVPEQLHAAGLRQPAEDPRPEEGGAGKGLGRIPPPLAQARGHRHAAPGGRRRHGACGPVGRLLPGACRAPGDAVRA